MRPRAAAVQPGLYEVQPGLRGGATGPAWRCNRACCACRRTCTTCKRASSLGRAHLHDVQSCRSDEQGPAPGRQARSPRDQPRSPLGRAHSHDVQPCPIGRARTRARPTGALTARSTAVAARACALARGATVLARTTSAVARAASGVAPRARPPGRSAEVDRQQAVRQQRHRACVRRASTPVVLVRRAP